MLGAIIGDLAAWTWENDYKNFYTKLVSQEAKLSDYAHTLLVTCDALMHDRDVPIGEYRRLLSFNGWEKERIKSVIRAIAVAWLYEDEEEMRHAIKTYCYCLWDDKEEIYAASFMAEIIYALRHGTTKKEAGQVDLVVHSTLLHKTITGRKGVERSAYLSVHGMLSIALSTIQVPYTMR